MESEKLVQIDTALPLIILIILKSGDITLHRCNMTGSTTLVIARVRDQEMELTIVPRGDMQIVIGFYDYAFTSFPPNGVDMNAASLTCMVFVVPVQGNFSTTQLHHKRPRILRRWAFSMTLEHSIISPFGCTLFEPDYLPLAYNNRSCGTIPLCLGSQKGVSTKAKGPYYN